MNSKWTLECRWEFDQAIQPMLTTDNYSDVVLTINDFIVNIHFVPSLNGKVVVLTLPDNLKIIGKQSFKACDYLLGIEIGCSVTEIEDEAFYGCSHLYSIKLPDSIKILGSNVFSFCNSLTEITLPHLEIMGEDLFNGCSNLRSIYIPFGSEQSFEIKWPDLRNILYECINGWKIIQKRHFNEAEKGLVKRAEVVPSQYGRSVCFFMSSGGQTYIPLLEESMLTAGDMVDMDKALLITLEEIEAQQGHYKKEQTTRVFE